MYKAVTHRRRAGVKSTYRYGDSSTGYFTKILPIFMGFFVFFFVFLISGIGLLRERSSGTLDRLLATPVRRGEIVTALRAALSNQAIDMQVTVVEAQNVKVAISPREKFEELKAKNSDLEEFVKTFGLRFD